MAGSKAPRPIRESQVRPILNKLPEDHQVNFWEGLTEKEDPKNLTLDAIAGEVDNYRFQLPPEEKRRFAVLSGKKQQYEELQS